MKKFLAIFLSVLMVSTSCVGLFTMTASAGEAAWLSVNGDTETANWYNPVIAGSNFDYRITYDATDLFLEFRTNDTLPTTGDVFRFWFRDEDDSDVYTDFITIKALAAGVYTVANAKYNTSKTTNAGANWADLSVIKLTNTLVNGVTSFKVTVPRSSFSGLATQDQLDFWVSEFLSKTTGTTTTISTLHSGNATSQPHQLWIESEDDTVNFGTAPVVDGRLVESNWQSGVTTVDGVKAGQWQTSSSITNAAFSYKYKAYAANGYLYIGVKYNKAPTFVSDSQTTASNIRIWMTKNIMTTPTGNFGNLVDIRYNGTKAVIVARTDDLDRSAMLLNDTQTTDSWTVEFAIPLTQLGFATYQAGDYIGLALSCSDPFMTLMGTPEVLTNQYGVLHSVYGLNYLDRTTFDRFYFMGLASNDVKTTEDDTVVSVGKTYTGTVAARSGWTDTATTSTKLTNGSVGVLRSLGGNGPFVGFQLVKNSSYSYQAGAWVEKTTSFEPDERNTSGVFYETIDLGASTDKLYNYSAKFGQIAAYGIYFPTMVSFYASVDGTSYYKLGTAAKGTVVNDGAATLKEWVDYTFTSQTAISARYIKVEITPTLPVTVAPTVAAGVTIPEGSTAAVSKASVTAISEITVIAKGGLLPKLSTTTVNTKADYVDLITTTTSVTAPVGSGNYTAALNDDTASSTASYDNKWYGLFYNGGAAATNTIDGVASIVIDLGAAKTYGTIKANVWQPNASGIGIPAIKAFASVNNKDWLELGTLTNPTGTIGWAKLDLATAMTSQYIKLEVVSNAAFAMMNEIEVYQYATATSFSADFANQYSVGYQDSTTWLYNGGTTLAGVGDAVYLFTSPEGKTLGEVSSTGIAWWDVWVVDYNTTTKKYFITAFYPSSGDNKASIVVPADGFVIAANGNGRNSINASLRETSAIGASVYVYGIDVQTLGTADTMAFKATNTISVFAPVDGQTAITPIVPGLYNQSDATKVVPNKALGVLTNGDKVSTATAFSNAGIVLFQNKLCTTAATYPTVDLLLALDKVTSVEKVNFSFYHEYLSMIGLPKDGKVTLSYSDSQDEAFTSLGEFTVNGTAATGTSGVVDTTITLTTAVDAQYIKISFAFGDSPFATATPSKPVWEFIGMTEISINNAVVIPDLPTGALTLDNFAGYVGGEGTIITRVGDNDTLGEVTAACSGTVKDYNYFLMAIVNSSNIVTEINQKLGRPDGVKTDVVIPEGGYILLYNATVGAHSQAMIDSFKAIKVGDVITLYNIDLTALATAAQVKPLVKGGFTVAAGVPVLTTGVNNLSNSTQIDINAANLAKLTDGDAALTAGNWGTGTSGVVLITNKVCTNAAINPTVKLVLKLDAAKNIDKVVLDFYHCYNVMIGLPKDNKVRLSSSTNGTDFTSLGEFTFTGTAAAGAFGTIAAEFDITDVEAQYIGIEFDIGPSGLTTDGKVVWEFNALTEVAVVEAVVADPLALVEDAPVEIEDGKLLGVTTGMTIAEIEDFFVGAVTVSGVGTGATVTAGGQTLTIIVLGDISGDGAITAVDYLYAKRAILGTATLTDAQNLAARVSGGTAITVSDYLKIKRHFLGTFDIFEVV